MARSYTSGEIITFVLFVILLGLVAAIAVQTWKESRVTPEELERRRRRKLVATGKMGDANLVEIRDHYIYYSYDVRGVEYTASQDVAALLEHIPADLSSAVGAVYVKYDPANPANSIILAEDWSGLRTPSRRP